MANSVTGVNEFMKLLEKVEKVPATALTKAAKAGAMIIREQSRQDAPVDTGNLKRGIKFKAEKRRTGKKIYQVKVIGDTFVKISKEGKRSFYPASQEYGWKLQNGKKKPGKYYLTNAVKNNRNKVEQVILEELANSLKALGG